MIPLYEATWIGLIQSKLASIKRFEEIAEWVHNLQQSHPDMPEKVKSLLGQYEVLALQKDQLFPEYETQEAKLILLKDHLSDLTMKHFPKRLDDVLREKYSTLLCEAIPNFAEGWQDDVEFRQGDDSLVMLFVFLSCLAENYNDAIWQKIFTIVEMGLMDKNEIVQADVSRAFLSGIAHGDLEKYRPFMSDNTYQFCKKIRAI